MGGQEESGGRVLQHGTSTGESVLWKKKQMVVDIQHKCSDKVVM